MLVGFKSCRKSLRHELCMLTNVYTSKPLTYIAYMKRVNVSPLCLNSEDKKTPNMLDFLVFIIKPEA